jgi:CheY-like chemotaxis protein
MARPISRLSTGTCRAGRPRLRTVKAVHPETPVIALSGQFRSGLVESCTAAQAMGVQRMIAKPFSRHDLLGAVHCVIVQAG